MMVNIFETVLCNYLEINNSLLRLRKILLGLVIKTKFFIIPLREKGTTSYFTVT